MKSLHDDRKCIPCSPVARSDSGRTRPLTVVIVDRKWPRCWFIIKNSRPRLAESFWKPTLVVNAISTAYANSIINAVMLVRWISKVNTCWQAHLVSYNIIKWTYRPRDEQPFEFYWLMTTVCRCLNFAAERLLPVPKRYAYELRQNKRWKDFKNRCPMIGWLLIFSSLFDRAVRKFSRCHHPASTTKRKTAHQVGNTEQGVYSPVKETTLTDDFTVCKEPALQKNRAVWYNNKGDVVVMVSAHCRALTPHLIGKDVL